ncbi:hypothetical protein CsSME_00034907 [Camellia sinensis var. sinensis]
MIVDKIRVQMDAFLEDGSHEATVAVAMCRDSCIVPRAAATEIELARKLKEFSFKETGTPQDTPTYISIPRLNDVIVVYVYTTKMFQLLLAAYSTISIQDASLFLEMNEDDATNCKFLVFLVLQTVFNNKHSTLAQIFGWIQI